LGKNPGHKKIGQWANQDGAEIFYWKTKRISFEIPILHENHIRFDNPAAHTSILSHLSEETFTILLLSEFDILLAGLQYAFGSCSSTLRFSLANKSHSKAFK